MRIGETLKKAAGLFVELPEDSTDDPLMSEFSTPARTQPAEEAATAPAPRTTTKTVEQIVRESPGPNLDEIHVPTTTPTQVIRDDGTIDFGAIYSMAQLAPSPFTAEQVLDLMATMPADLPIETKRQAVKMTLGAMTKTVGVSPETVVADASRKLAALAAYAEGFTRQADEYVAKSEAEIKNLELEIEKRKMAIEEAKQRQAKMTSACHAESDRLDDILEFFSLDVPPSKYAATGGG
jgi:hypothetical protein